MPKCCIGAQRVTIAGSASAASAETEPSCASSRRPVVRRPHLLFLDGPHDRRPEEAMKRLNMTVAERGSPLPGRPGTIWTTDPPANTCLNCGQSYGGHGAPEDVADELRIDRSK